jgi:hypothetical protein
LYDPAKEMVGCFKPRQLRKYDYCRGAGHHLEDGLLWYFCTHCRNAVPVNAGEGNLWKNMNNHRCYIHVPELKIGEENSYWVWDIETIVKEVRNDRGGFTTKLVPYLLCMMRMVPDASSVKSFWGEDCVEQFVRYVGTTKEFKNTTFLAHNSAGFDSHFLKPELHKLDLPYDSVPAPGSIHNYLEIKITSHNIRFIDSFRFINIGLGKFGKTFKLLQGKGDFPHRFSTGQHLDYSGPFPPLDLDGEDYFDVRNRFKGSGAATLLAEKRDFIAWHEEECKKYTPHTDQFWNFKEQLLEYCIRDCVKSRSIAVAVMEPSTVKDPVIVALPAMVPPVLSYLPDSTASIRSSSA